MICFRSSGGLAFLLVLVALAVAPPVSAQDASQDSDPGAVSTILGEPVQAAEPAEPSRAPEPSSAAEPVDSSAPRQVVLQPDGTLVGHVQCLGPAGAMMPAMATVNFIREKRVVASARSNLEGYFQVTGLSLGQYAVIAHGEAGFSAFSVLIAAHVAKVPDGQMVLEITLVPGDIVELLNPELVEEGQEVPMAAIPAEAACCGGGGGGGAGGGLWALAGLGGLAGLAGLAGAPASPFAP